MKSREMCIRILENMKVMEIGTAMRAIESTLKLGDYNEKDFELLSMLVPTVVTKCERELGRRLERRGEQQGQVEGNDHRFILDFTPLEERGRKTLKDEVAGTP